ncbi:MAG: PilZ domain-containing protein, partial [Deefgea sp.]
MFDFKSLISAILGKSKNEGVYDLKSATVMMKELPESDILQAQIEIIKALQQINGNPRTNIKERFKT